MKKVALLILSCDKYNDLWENYFILFNKFWPDCPFPVYLQTNALDFDCEIITNVIKVGEDNSWSEDLLQSLSYLEQYDYVLLMMEDMFLNRKVSNTQILSVLDDFFNVNGNFITLINEPNYDKKFSENFGIISPGAMYRSTATAALWRKKVLVDILRENETAWDFEKKGSIRTDQYDGFYAVVNNCFSFFHGVVKGQWTMHAVKEFNKIGLDIDFSTRKVFSSRTSFFRVLYIYIRKFVLMIVPFKYRRFMLRK
jgi:hypothetical protein